MSTKAPDIFTIDGHRFTLVAVWQENRTGNSTFQGYMLYPHDQKPPKPLKKGSE